MVCVTWVVSEVVGVLLVDAVYTNVYVILIF